MLRLCLGSIWHLYTLIHRVFASAVIWTPSGEHSPLYCLNNCLFFFEYTQLTCKSGSMAQITTYPIRSRSSFIRLLKLTFLVTFFVGNKPLLFTFFQLLQTITFSFSKCLNEAAIPSILTIEYLSFSNQNILISITWQYP